MKNDNIFHPLAFIMDMWHFEILTKSWISDKSLHKEGFR